jgi:hypothetical protein
MSWAPSCAPRGNTPCARCGSNKREGAVRNAYRRCHPSARPCGARSARSKILRRMRRRASGCYFRSDESRNRGGAFLLLLFSRMWLSLAVSAYNHVSYGAREDSRYAAVHGTDSKQPVTTASAVTAFVQNKTAGLDTSKLTVNTTWTFSATPGSPAARSKSRSSISFNFPFPLCLLLPCR